MPIPSLTQYPSGTIAPTGDQMNTLIQTANNVVALRGFIGLTNMAVYLQGFTSPNDGGQGMFQWNPTSTAPDDGGINRVVPTGLSMGCWSRLPAGITGNVTYNVPSQYATIADVLAVLDRQVISSSANITINLAPGTYTSTSTLIINKLYGQQLSIVGAAPINLSVTSLNSVTGTVGNFAVKINVTSTTGVSVGQFVRINSLTGTGAYLLHYGCWKITAVTASTITLANSCQLSVFPASTITGGTISVLTSVLQFNGCSGLVASNVGLIDQIAIVGDRTVNTIGISNGDASVVSYTAGTINFGQKVGINGFASGLYAHFSGSIHAYLICSSNNMIYGLQSQHSGSLMIYGAVSSGNGNHGVITQYSGSANFESGIAVGNGQYGILQQLGGGLLAKSCVANYNGIAGIASFYNGLVQCFSATVSNNTSYGIYTQFGGTVYASNAQVTNNGVNGIYAVDRGIIDAGSAILTGNGSNAASADRGAYINMYSSSVGVAQIYAQNGSWINAVGVTGSPVYFPSANTQGNTLSYIDTV